MPEALCPCILMLQQSVAYKVIWAHVTLCMEHAFSVPQLDVLVEVV